jgi:fatty acid amide hydrolase
MKESAGLPVSVQVVTLPYEEELCLNVMRQIEEAVQFRKNHPYPV